MALDPDAIYVDSKTGKEYTAQQWAETFPNRTKVLNTEAAPWYETLGRNAELGIADFITSVAGGAGQVEDWLGYDNGPVQQFGRKLTGGKKGLEQDLYLQNLAGGNSSPYSGLNIAGSVLRGGANIVPSLMLSPLRAVGAAQKLATLKAALTFGGLGAGRQYGEMDYEQATTGKPLESPNLAAGLTAVKDAAMAAPLFGVARSAMPLAKRVLLDTALGAGFGAGGAPVDLYANTLGTGQAHTPEEYYQAAQQGAVAGGAMGAAFPLALDVTRLPGRFGEAQAAREMEARLGELPPDQIPTKLGPVAEELAALQAVENVPAPDQGRQFGRESGEFVRQRQFGRKPTEFVKQEYVPPEKPHVPRSLSDAGITPPGGFGQAWLANYMKRFPGQNMPDSVIYGEDGSPAPLAIEGPTERLGLPAPEIRALPAPDEVLQLPQSVRGLLGMDVLTGQAPPEPLLLDAPQKLLGPPEYGVRPEANDSGFINILQPETNAYQLPRRPLKIDLFDHYSLPPGVKTPKVQESRTTVNADKLSKQEMPAQPIVKEPTTPVQVQEQAPVKAVAKAQVIDGDKAVRGEFAEPTKIVAKAATAKPKKVKTPVVTEKPKEVPSKPEESRPGWQVDENKSVNMFVPNETLPSDPSWQSGKFVYSTRKIGSGWYNVRERADLPIADRQIEILSEAFNSREAAAKWKPEEAKAAMGEGIPIEDYRPGPGEPIEVALTSPDGTLVSDRNSIIPLPAKKKDVVFSKQADKNNQSIQDYWNETIQMSGPEVMPVGVFSPEGRGERVLLNNGSNISRPAFERATQNAENGPMIFEQRGDRIAVLDKNRILKGVLASAKEEIPPSLQSRVGPIEEVSKQMPPRSKWMSQRGAVVNPVTEAVEIAKDIYKAARKSVNNDFPTLEEMSEGSGRVKGHEVTKADRWARGDFDFGDRSIQLHSKLLSPAVAGWRRFMAMQETVAKKNPEYEPMWRAAQDKYRNENAVRFDMQDKLSSINTVTRNPASRGKINAFLKYQLEAWDEGRAVWDERNPQVMAELGFSPTEQRAILETREAMSYALDTIKQGMIRKATANEPIPEKAAAIEAKIEEWAAGMNPYYMPRVRKGDQYVWARDGSGATTDFYLFKRGDKNRGKVSKMLEKEGKYVDFGEMKNPVGDAADSLPPDLQVLLLSTGDAPEDGGVQKPIYGFKQHLVKAKGTPGYEKDFIKGLNDYALGLGSWYSDQLFKVQSDAAIQSLAQSTLLQRQAQRLQTQVREGGNKGRAVRQFLSVYYLTRPASAAVNYLQPWMTVLPDLVQEHGFVKGTTTMGSAFLDGLRNSALLEKSPLALKRKDPDLYNATLEAKRQGIIGHPATDVLRAEARRGDQGALSRVANDISDLGLTLFSAAEVKSREAAFIANYKAGRDAGLSASDSFQRGAIKTNERFEKAARDTTSQMFDYTLANRPEASTGYGAIPFTFQLFAGNVLRQYRNNFTPARWKAFVTQLGVSTALGGAIAAPLSKVLIRGMEELGEDPVRDGRKWLKKMGASDWWQDTLTYGLGHEVAGLNISQNVAVGDLGQGAKSIPEVIGRIAAGPAMGVVDRALRAKDLYSMGRTTEAIDQLSGPLVQNLREGWRMLQTGEARSPRGEFITNVSPKDAVAKMAGFNPASVAEENQRRHSEWVLQEASKDSAHWNKRIADALFTEGDAGVKRVLSELMEYNASAEPHKQVRPDKASIKNYFLKLKTGRGRIPKKLANEVKDIQTNY